jgi:hypothetical protein
VASDVTRADDAAQIAAEDCGYAVAPTMAIQDIGLKVFHHPTQSQHSRWIPGSIEAKCMEGYAEAAGGRRHGAVSWDSNPDIMAVVDKPTTLYEHPVLQATPLAAGHRMDDSHGALT